MKKFKHLLSEFIDNFDSKRRNDDDARKRVRAFMEKTPFTHVTTGGDELHFIDSLDAANLASDYLANHEHGMKFANNKKDKMMSEYFGFSTGTHDDVLRAIQSHIEHHRDLPNELIPHVEPVMREILDRSTQRSNSMNFLHTATSLGGHDNKIGEITYNRHAPSESVERHPHIMNDTHHLQDLIDRVIEDPSRGYFLTKDEM